MHKSLHLSLFSQAVSFFLQIHLHDVSFVAFCGGNGSCSWLVWILPCLLLCFFELLATGAPPALMGLSEVVNCSGTTWLSTPLPWKLVTKSNKGWWCIRSTQLWWNTMGEPLYGDLYSAHMIDHIREITVALSLTWVINSVDFTKTSRKNPKCYIKTHKALISSYCPFLMFLSATRKIIERTNNLF